MLVGASQMAGFERQTSSPGPRPSPLVGGIEQPPRPLGARLSDVREQTTSAVKLTHEVLARLRGAVPALENGHDPQRHSGEGLQRVVAEIENNLVELAQLFQELLGLV